MEFRRRVIEVIEAGMTGDAAMYVLPVMLCLHAVTDIMGEDRAGLANAFVEQPHTTFHINWFSIWKTLEPVRTKNQLVMVRAGWELFCRPYSGDIDELFEGYEGEAWSPVTIDELCQGLDWRSVELLMLAIRIRRQDRDAMRRGVEILREAVERTTAMA